jgi:hypothetical protein
MGIKGITVHMRREEGGVVGTTTLPRRSLADGNVVMEAA